MCLTFAYLYNLYIYIICIVYSILYYNMYWLCMIATIPLATRNKLNCFISARGMLAIVWHCVLLLFFLCVFFVDFYMLINHLLKKK